MKEHLLKNNIWTLKLIIEESPVPMALYTGKDMQISLVNNAWLTTWGKEETVVDKTLHTAFPEWKDQSIFSQLEHVFKSAQTYEAAEDLINVTIKGKVNKLYFNVNFKPLINEDGKVWAILHTCTDVSELVWARKRADKAESHLQFILESAAMGSWDIDLSNKTVWWDKKCSELLGNLEGNWGTYQDVLNCIDPLDTERFNKALTLISSIASEKAYSITVKTRRTNNNPTKWLECKGRAYYDDEGTINRFAGIVHDITAQTLLEKEQQMISDKLALSDLRFRDTIEHAPVAIGVLRGQDLIIEEANQELLKLWGRKKTVIGMPVSEALPEIRDQGFIELMLRVYQTGQPYLGFETAAVLEKNGRSEQGYFNFVYAPVRETREIVRGIVIVASEVTEQVQARLKLLSIENRFRDFILEAPMPTVLYVGPEIRIEIVNDAMLKLWGKDASIVDKTFKEALPELHGQPFQSLLEQVYASGQAYHSEQHRADLLVNGQLKTSWFNFTYKPIHDENGMVYGILHMAVDITSQVQIQRQKDEFLGVASHELKTPVTSIMAYTQLLERMLLKNKDKEQATMVGKLNQQVNRLTHLINDLLDVTKFQSGTLLFNEETFAFNKLVTEVTEEVQRTSENHVISLILDENPIVYADRERIGQVIVNLLTNAIKYSPGKKEIKVYSVITNDTLILHVQDFGIGIADDKKERVFEQFYRVSGDLEHTFPGLGLGLYISSQIVIRAGGEMWVESETGKGSTFSFAIPIDRRKTKTA